MVVMVEMEDMKFKGRDRVGEEEGKEEVMK